MIHRYTVVFTSRVERQVESAYAGIALNWGKRFADQWIVDLRNRIRTLGRFPRRRPLIPEGEELRTELRQLIVGRKRGRYRLIYEVREQEVLILLLHFHHAMEERPSPDVLGEVEE